MPTLRPHFAVQYATSSNEAFWVDLEGVKKRGKQSPWRHSGFFEQVAVATEKLKIPFSEFQRWSDADKAIAIAYYRVTGAMSAYEDHLREREQKKK